MNHSYTIIRRFTPPTCTLEIWGKNSPLSRWTKKTTVKDAKFELSFDDPRNLDAEPIKITGDRDKLEQLYDVILSYTENFLEQSFTNQVPVVTLNSHNRLDDSPQPYLTSQGLVHHQLNLGNLVTTENPLTISLSATQLFDLVSALEEYKIEMAVLTELETQQTKKARKIIPVGLSVAGILLAVGLTTVGLKIANQPEKQEQIASKSEPTTEATPTTPTEDVIPPEVPKITQKPAVGIKKNDPLASNEKLPPPPAVDTPKPPPDIPDPAKYPPSGNLTIPPITSAPLENATPETKDSTTSAPTPTDNSQVESNIAIAPETTKPETKPNSELEIATESQTEITTPPSITENNNPQPLKPDESAEITTGNSETTITTDTEVEAQLDRSASFSDKIAGEDVTADSSAQNSPPNNDDLTLANGNLKPTTEESNVPEPESASKIPQIPQLTEVATYFRQKWRSPSELKQTLEYRLVIAQNGSIQRIIPIGKASEIYLDRTNIPLMGEPFVSALENKSNLTIRLLLSPDGEVRTFLE